MAVLGRLDQPNPEPLLLGDLGEPVQQDGLAGSAQPDHQEALARPPRGCPAEGDSESVDELVPAGQSGRGSTGTWTERIGELIHGFNESYANKPIL